MRKPRCPSSIGLISVGSEAQKTNKVRKQQAKKLYATLLGPVNN